MAGNTPRQRKALRKLRHRHVGPALHRRNEKIQMIHKPALFGRPPHLARRCRARIRRPGHPADRRAGAHRKPIRRATPRLPFANRQNHPEPEDRPNSS